MKILIRQKLDIVNQTRSNLFGWRGPFTPEFVARDLREAAIKRALRDDSRRAMHHCSTNR
jgi:rRNA-processing protein FCF1